MHRKRASPRPDVYTPKNIRLRPENEILATPSESGRVNHCPLEIELPIAHCPLPIGH
jgi:hypothetical protein